MLESLFNKVAGLKVCNILKRQTPTQVFPVDIATFLRIVFLYNTFSGCFWQSYHGTVKSTGVPVLWFRAFTCIWFWSKTFTNIAQIILYYTSQNNFFLAWIDCSRVFAFRICFGKTLIVFDFDETLTQSVAQVTVWYHV